MTTATHRPLFDSTDSLLRFALRADATVCAGVGLVVAMAADALAQVSGLSPTTEWVLGAALVAYGALLYLLAAAPALRTIGIGIVVANVVFSAVTTATVLAGWLTLTPAGAALTLGFVAVTMALAYAQYLGVRRMA